jgi:hypothetical protein
VRIAMVGSRNWPQADCRKRNAIAGCETGIVNVEQKWFSASYRFRWTAAATGRRSAIYMQPFRLIFWAAGLLLVSLTVSYAGGLSCDAIMRDAYDRSRGLTIWDQFPKIGVPIADPQRQLFVNHGVPLAEKIWRFMNDIDSDEPIRVTPHFAMRIKSIAGVDDLWGDKVLYVSLSKVIGRSPIQPEKVDTASRKILQSRIDGGSPIITSYNFDIKESGKISRIAFVSPVIRNIPPNGLSDFDLATTFLEVFTNLRIEEVPGLRDEVAREYTAGCLDVFSKECTIFDIARNMYRHTNDLKKDLEIDVASKICHYVRVE